MSMREKSKILASVIEIQHENWRLTRILRDTVVKVQDTVVKVQFGKKRLHTLRKRDIEIQKDNLG